MLRFSNDYDSILAVTYGARIWRLENKASLFPPTRDPPHRISPRKTGPAPDPPRTSRRSGFRTVGKPLARKTGPNPQKHRPPRPFAALLPTYKMISLHGRSSHLRTSWRGASG